MSELTHYRSAWDTVKKLHIEPGHTVLDIGCGDAYHFKLVHRHLPRVVIALDIDFNSLSACAGSYRAEWNSTATPPGAFVLGDALRLPFGTETFDRVICSLVLYLLPLRESIAELHRILKPGGKVYLRMPMLAWGRAAAVFSELPNIRRFAYASFHVLNGAYFLLAGRQCRSLTQACYVPRQRFEQAARDAGFEFDDLRVDNSRPLKPSIDAWLHKAA